MFYLCILQPPVSRPLSFPPSIPLSPRSFKTKGELRVAADWLSWRLSKCVCRYVVCVCVTCNNGGSIRAPGGSQYHVSVSAGGTLTTVVVFRAAVCLTSCVDSLHSIIQVCVVFVCVQPHRSPVMVSVCPPFCLKHDFMFFA